MTFEFLSVFVEYDAEEGYYSVLDSLVRFEIGFLNLVEGPGWVFCPRSLHSLEFSELSSITELVSELNSTLS